MKKYIFLIIIILLISACSDILDENPKAISTEKFYNTVDEIADATNAIYAPLKGTYAFGIYIPRIMEANADYGYARSGFTSDYQGYSATIITRIGLIWTQLYLSIRNANLVIKNTPNSSGTTDGEKAKYLGEAKFLRAFTYFTLVRFWGGVPIRTEGNMDEINLARSSVNDVYSLILNDLKYSEENLPDVPRLVGAPSKWAAKTLLADVYLNLKDWRNARDKAAEVIKSGKYSLVNVNKSDDFNNLFGSTVSTTPEEIFYMKYIDGTSSDYGWYFLMDLHYSTSTYFGKQGWGNIYTTTDNLVIKNWDNGDLRKQYNLYSCDLGIGTNTLLFKKFYNKDAKTNFSGNDYPLYRYADLLLIYCEAETQTNSAPTADALECLNKIHRRAYGYDPSLVSSSDYKIENYNKDSFIDLIIKERGYETLTEGKRWLELVRTGRASKIISDVKNISIADKHYLMPIPVVETSYNKSIDPIADQNPGY